MAASLIGKTLKNRYQVVESLGRGGMAEVYKVYDSQRAVHLAMKILRQDIAQDPVFLRRFQREAKALADLQHPNIVRFFGLDRDDLLAFLLMEYVEGLSLQAEILRSAGNSLKPARMLEIMRPVCAALHYAHSQGVVHCDIKPGNILLDNNGRILLTDFGIARTLDAATSTMVGIGTPAYMAPELIKGLDPTPQTDIYALGIVLYEMATGGERPFTGETASVTGTTAEKVRWEHLKLAPVPPSTHNPHISPDLEAIIMRCLEKDPQQRFATALQLLQALQPVPGSIPPEAVSQGLGSAQVKSENNQHEPSPAQAQPSVNSQPSHFSNKIWIMGLFGAVVISILILGLNQVNKDAHPKISNPLPTKEATHFPTSAPTPFLKPEPKLASADEALTAYQDGTVPVASSNVAMSGSHPLLIQTSNLAINKETLDKNLKSMNWSFVINGKNIPNNQTASAYYYPFGDLARFDSMLLVKEWPIGEHEVRVDSAITQQIFDGWDNYLPQKTVDIHRITTTPGFNNPDYKIWPIVSKDNFSNNNSDWWTGVLHTDDYGFEGNLDIVDGSFRLSIDEFENEVASLYQDKKLVLIGDFYLSALTWVEGVQGFNCQGIKFLDSGNFSICDSREYFIWDSNGDGQAVVDLTNSKDINPDGENEIAVLKLGNKLSFFINGVKQTEINNFCGDWGSVGFEILATSQPFSFYIDNFTIRMP